MTGVDRPELRMGTPRGRWVLFTTVLGSGLAMLDATVVNVALGRIGAEFDAGFSGLQWTVNAYTLTLASLILLGGSLGDRFGRRRVFVVGVVWFAVASLLCGVAQNIEMLVAARALQGVGGALLTPGSLAIISASFRGSDRAAAVGAWSGLGGIAGAVGPFLGGWLVEWSWRAVFLVNLPVAVLIVVVAARHVPESRDPDAAPRLDLAGTALAVLGLAGLTYSLTAAGEQGVDTLVLSVGVAGVLALAGFVLVERRSTHPLVPMTLFRNRQFSAANAVTLMIYAALGGLFVLLVLQLQIVVGFSPLQAGAALLPVTVLMLVFSAGAGRLGQRLGPRIPITAGTLIAAGGLVLISRIGADASFAVGVLVPVIVFGCGLTLVVAPLTSTVLDSASDRHAGVASGVNNAIARAAGLLAVAVIPVAAGITGEDYTDPAAFGAGFRTAMLISAAMMVLAAVLAAAFLRRPGAEPDEAEPGNRIRPDSYAQCAITGPQIHPGPPVAALPPEPGTGRGGGPTD
ncbi:EmrB/QacA subfamily drug resistance transporter [Pseudonocardia autotrophica]|uniref:Multidrug resistance protein stp n=3 Tax=Pseudonocardiaceae TaxID=2070 RepID=A0A1Y2MNK6_PSEAH|nr:Multidrug resistance protein stp [Pseudonocardia autotrophica]TDN73065.1 EmrB/QacA subfamily drug resistance transporter [Pseudonocardia autotrophica]BBG03783.1 MFS transporter [Pseudonocardia autotrophica]GEC26609.1 MFS transporter [Pseudonocardia saturnea]